MAVLVAMPEATAAYASRGPIIITGDSGFTADNGVTGGDGTYANPYVISGWEISTTGGPSNTGIAVTDTSAYFVIRDVYVHFELSSYIGGIGFWNVSNCAVENSVVRGGSDGILMSWANNVVIAGNTISGKSEGVYCQFSNVISLKNNNIHNRFTILYTSNVTAQANLFDSEGIYLASNLHAGGDVFADYASHTITSDNLINGKPILYFKNQQDLKIESIPVGQLILVRCTNASIANLDIAGACVGVNMAFVDNATIQGCRIEDCVDAGIRADWSANATISTNDISNTTGYGIFLLNSTTIIANNTIVNELAQYRRIGILVNYRAKTWICNNTISGNYYAISVQSSSDQKALITQNLISHNVYSIYIEAPAVAFSLDCSKENEARIASTATIQIHHNIFGSSYGLATDEVGIAWDNGYPSGGNFWSDYEGADQKSGPNQDQPGSDGIGDTRRNVSSKGFDRYPLMSLSFGSDKPPIASFTVIPESGDVGTVFEFNASSVADLEDSVAVLEIRWDWDNDGAWDVNWTNNKTAYHGYSTPGNYTVRLEVMDRIGLTDSYSMQIVVRPTSAAWSNAFVIAGILILVCSATALVVLIRLRKAKEPSSPT